MYDPGPSSIQCLIPDTARVCFDVEVVGPGENEPTAFVVNTFTVFVLQEVHLVDEAEDIGGGTELFQGFDDGAISVEVLLDFTGLDVKDVN